MMVALASRGVRLMPSKPKTMAPATTKTKKRQTLASTPDIVVTRAPARWRAGTGGGLVRHPFEDAPDDLGAEACRNEGDDDNEKDAERPDDEVGDRRRRVRADAELGQEVVEPPAALVDLIRLVGGGRPGGREPARGADQGVGRRQGGRGHGRYCVPESAL